LYKLGYEHHRTSRHIIDILGSLSTTPVSIIIALYFQVPKPLELYTIGSHKEQMNNAL